MAKWDKEYLKLCRKILTDGVRVKNRTGIDTIKIPSYELKFDLGEEFPFLTTKQLYYKAAIKEITWIMIRANNDVRWLQERGVHIWDEWEVDEDGIYRVYCLEKNGKFLLNSREIRTDWVPTNNTRPVYLIKKRLAGNQVIIAYLMKAKHFQNYVVDPVLTAKRQNMRFKVSGGVVTLNKGGKIKDLMFESVRREPGWEERFLTKMSLYAEFYEYFNIRDSGFEAPPQLVLVGEDDQHLVEIFKLIVKNKIVLIVICSLVTAGILGYGIYFYIKTKKKNK